MINMLLWNCNGPSEAKSKDLFRIIKEEHISLCVLTETHRMTNPIRRSGWSCVQTPSNARQGVAVFARNDVKLEDVKVDEKYRYIICNITTGGKKYRLLALYAPTGNERNKWWENNYKLLTKRDIILGDFNFVLDQNRDRNKPSTDMGKKNLTLIRPILEGYCDAAVEAKNMSFTYKNVSRLDRVYYNSDNLVLQKYRIHHNKQANDHHMVRVRLQHKGYKPPFWRFKSYLMIDETTKAKVKSYLSDTSGNSWTEQKRETQIKLKEWEKITMHKRKKHLQTV